MFKKALELDQAIEFVGKAKEGLKGVTDTLTPEKSKYDYMELQKALNALANALTALGLDMSNIKNEEGLIDPEKLLIHLGSNMPTMMLKSSEGEIAGLANTMTDFITSAKAFLPNNFSNVFLQWLQKQFGRGGTIKEVQGKIQQFIEDLGDRQIPKDEYVWAMLTGNFQLASILKIMYSYGQFDANTFKSLNEISKEALVQLGPQHAGLMNAMSLMGAKGLTNLKTILKDNATVRFLTPAEISKEKFLQFEQDFIRNAMDSEVGKIVSQHPEFQIIWGITTGADDALKGLGSGLGGVVTGRG